MLKWIRELGGGDSVEAFDRSSAAGLISGLPADNSFKCLEELAYGLESLSNSKAGNAVQRLEIIDLIDHAARPHCRKLTSEYLTSRLQKYQENLLWTTIFQFCRQLGTSYRDLAYAAGRGALAARLPTIAARAINAFALQLKWGLLRYGPIDPQIWNDLAGIYAFTETQGVHRVETTMYPEIYGASCVEREFLKALMLAVSAADKLMPTQLEIAERVIGHLGVRFTIGSVPGEDAPYYFSLSGKEPPMRRLRDVELAGDLRFFGAGESARELDKLIHSVKTGLTVADLNLGAAYTQRGVIEVLRHLSQQWAVKLPTRKSERRNSMARLSVLSGYSRIFCVLAGGDGGDAESWIAQNTSAVGYGAVIQQVKGDWLQVGSLVGVKTEDDSEWSLGVIRRLSRDSQHQRHVGIELFARAVRPAQLLEIEAASSAPPMHQVRHQAMDCILLSSPSHEAAEIILLLQPGCYNAELGFEMRADGESVLIAPDRLIEEGEEYDLARFRFIQPG